MTGSSPDAPRVLGITMGDPAGIGVEVVAKAWEQRQQELLPPFFLIADSDYPARHQSNIPIEVIAAPEETEGVFSRALPVMSCGATANVTVGQPDPVNANAVLQSIDLAVEFALSGRIAGLVTAPIHKDSLIAAGFEYPGHTEYLGHLAGDQSPPVMMLTCPGLRVVPVTIHLGLAKAIGELTQALIFTHGQILERALRQDFGIDNPRIAVAALNPHAGESGEFGDEEERIIAPAIEELRAAGLKIDGPFPADSLFHEAARRNFDAVLCMYHDQALIPLKTIDFWNGVNVTLGLPFVRTSPDHGTAHDIAGTGSARADSMIAAIKTADQMARRHQAAAATETTS